MRTRSFGTVLVILAMLIALAGSAQAVSANVVMKVSRTAQDSVINVGEELTIDVDLGDTDPAVYKWYFNAEPIPDSDGRAHVISNAQLSDAGIYRIEAYADDGRMLVSMDFAVRVIDETLPQAGDKTLSPAIVISIMAMSAAVLTAACIKRKTVK